MSNGFGRISFPSKTVSGFPCFHSMSRTQSPQRNCTTSLWIITNLPIMDSRISAKPIFAKSCPVNLRSRRRKLLKSFGNSRIRLPFIAERAANQRRIRSLSLGRSATKQLVSLPAGCRALKTAPSSQQRCQRTTSLSFSQKETSRKLSFCRLPWNP